MGDVREDIDASMALLSNLEKNRPFVKDGANTFSTPLPKDQEQKFRDWVAANKVPFDPNRQVQDYDMRGFYKALTENNPIATTAVNANDGMIHYPDYWKTPFHKSFSNESKWANKSAPKWNAQDQLVLPNGTVVFDERSQK